MHMMLLMLHDRMAGSREKIRISASATHIAPLDFGGARFCEARVWSGFNMVNNQMGQYLDYAMGENL